jgi:hypothetical protein
MFADAHVPILSISVPLNLAHLFRLPPLFADTRTAYCVTSHGSSSFLYVGSIRTILFAAFSSPLPPVDNCIVRESNQRVYQPVSTTFGVAKNGLR